MKKCKCGEWCKDWKRFCPHCGAEFLIGFKEQARLYVKSNPVQWDELFRTIYKLNTGRAA